MKRLFLLSLLLMLPKLGVAQAVPFQMVLTDGTNCYYSRAGETNLIGPTLDSFAGIYAHEVVHPYTLAQGTNYYALTNTATVGPEAGAGYAVGAAAGTITIGVNGVGTYRIFNSVSFKTGGNVSIEGAVFDGATEIDQTTWHSDPAAALETVGSGCGNYALTNGAILTMQIQSDKANQTVTVRDFQLTIDRVGP